MMVMVTGGSTAGQAHDPQVAAATPWFAESMLTNSASRSVQDLTNHRSSSAPPLHGHWMALAPGVGLPPLIARHWPLL